MSGERVERRLAAILAADVTGYSRLMEQDEVGTLSRLRTCRRELIDPLVTKHQGRIVKTTGDGLLIEFSSIVEAVDCAVSVQEGMGKWNAAKIDGQRIEFRVGINLGDVIIEDDDVHGDGVNLAARLEGIAEPGGICISEDAFRQVRGKIEIEFLDGGEQALKNIARRVRVHHWKPASIGKPSTATARTVRAPVLAMLRVSRWALATLAIMLALGAVGLWWELQVPKVDQPKTASHGAPDPNAAPRGPVRTNIAVLPFVNQSGDATQDYFSDGITEDLIAALGRFPELAVVARNASFSYKGKAPVPKDIGRDLGVRYIVEGSVRRAGSRVRVSAQLSDAATGNLMWSQQYDEELKEVFALQDSVTRQVAGALAVNLGRIEQRRAATKPTGNLDAYDLVLRGREKFRLATRAGNRQARSLFEEAIQIDPRYADAHAALGRAFAEVATVGWTEDLNEAVDRVLEYARKALVLDPDNPEALSVLAWVHTVRSQYDLALAVSDRALTINPSHADSMFESAAVLTWLGRIGDAVAASEAALRIDPNPRPGQIFSIAMAYYQARRHADAVQLLERSLLRFPTYSFLYAVLAASYGQMGRTPEAAQALAQLRRLNPFFDPASSGSRFQNHEHQSYFIEGLTKAGLM